jgi:hypothetical protein
LLTESQHYNHLANQNRAANETEYKAWVLKHTPQQIRDANFARLALKRKHKMTGSRVVRIEDDRQAKSPKNGILFFMMERRGSGDFKDIPLIEATKLMASEYRTLSADEKKVGRTHSLQSSNTDGLCSPNLEIRRHGCCGQGAILPRF